MPSAAQFSINFVRNVVGYAAGRGVAIGELCARAEFSAELLAMPDAMVDGPAVDRVWQVVLAETQDRDLGLHIGEAFQPASLGIVGFAMMSSTTLGGALDKAIRYWNLMSDATSIRLRSEGGVAGLELLVHELPGNFLLTNRHPAESSLAAAMALARTLTGRALTLTDVGSTYPRVAQTLEYERIFGRKVRFEAESNRIYFPAACLEWPVLYSNPEMLRSFEGQIRKRLEQNPVSASDRVRQVLARSLQGEVPDLSTVATALHMSERALQRELQAEGATFRQVLDHLRRDLALAYLGDGEGHSIADISFLLGFSEPSVFHRYFRRWTGLTPSEYRRRGPEHDPT
ncbi:MAG: AraC family transcriptional regulator [Acidobacteriota bacterium]